MNNHDKQFVQRAVDVATHAHRDHYRKASHTPYITHPLAVMELAREVTDDPEVLAACMLHDVMEDVPEEYSWEQMRADFGERVVRIVEGVTKIEHDSWEVRSRAYIDHLAVADEGSLVVSAADKLHNLTCILDELDTLGEEVWQRFNSPRERQAWFYDAVCSAIEARMPGNALAVSLRNAVDELQRRIG